MDVGAGDAATASALVAALSDPGLYPHAPERVELVETHVSWVFLAGDRVYKLKKPLVLPFLDYGTPQRRRDMCAEEVRLGRRLAPRVYLGVRALVPDGDGWRLGDADDPAAADYVVEQRRFDERQTLQARLERGEDGAEAVRRLAAVLARFHAEAERAPRGRFGAPAVARAVHENFETLAAIADLPERGRLAAAHRFATAFLDGRWELLAAREAAGHVREGHGDLRLEHVICDGDDVQVFDPVEFDPALRFIDVAADVAFLVMELAHLGRDDLARELADAYRAAGGDLGPAELLAFYAAYRAWVRAKVAFVRAAELDPGDARRAEAVERGRALAATAGRLEWRARGPLALVVCGGAATGKTHLARELARLSGWAHVSSDAVRKELAGIAPTERAPLEQYREEASLRTYAALGERARAVVAAGEGVIVDATFRRRTHREAFTAAYGDDVPAPWFVECRAPASVVAERAAARMRDPARVSDATAEIAARHRREFEPLDEVPAGRHLLVRTDRPVAEIADRVTAAIDAERWAAGG